MESMENMYCPILCHKETPHEIVSEHIFRCIICAAEYEEVYCHACSIAGGADKPIYHFPPTCKDLDRRKR